MSEAPWPNLAGLDLNTFDFGRSFGALFVAAIGIPIAVTALTWTFGAGRKARQMWRGVFIATATNLALFIGLTLWQPPSRLMLVLLQTVIGFEADLLRLSREQQSDKFRSNTGKDCACSTPHR